MSRRDYFKHSQSQQYRNKGRANPYFHDKKNISWKFWSVLAACLIFSVGACFFFLAHPVFSIDEISVEGLEYIAPVAFQDQVMAYLQQPAGFIFHRSNRFLFSAESLEEHLKISFTFSDFQASQEGRRLLITLQERRSHLIWMAQKEFLVDLEGIVIRSLELENPEDQKIREQLPIFYDTERTEATVGSIVLTSQEISNALKFHEYLAQQDIAIKQTAINRLAGGWMNIHTQKDFDIYIDPTGNIDQQAHNLQTVLNAQISNPEGLEYIDVRFGDHVYYK